VTAISPLVKDMIERQLRALVLDTPFPCLGARSAFRNHGYVFQVYEDLRTDAGAAALADGLREFTKKRHELGNFYTFIASFVEPGAVSDESSWDRQIWEVLQRLHDLDTEPWDDRWSTTPEDADFALSFAGCGQLVVTLYPGASRYSRRFAWPTLIFNPPEQDRANFPDDESFLRFQDTIRARDVRLQGTMNPSLPPTLDDPQAPGFSGAPVGDHWRCPIKIRPTEE
jgi:FPC/CPF motif-containing protein YcgG